jgi:uncharacterized protein DUF3631/Toprim domain-containing protein
MSLPALETIAELLGGDISNGEVLCPGPGHSETDRSLSVKAAPKADGGFVVHSFCGDDPIACRDHVRRKLGLPAFEPKSNGNSGGGAWKLISEHIYRTKRGEPFLRVRKCLDENGKKQYPQARWDGTQWVKGKPKAPKLPYLLPQLAASNPATPIYFCEGEKDVDALAKLGFTATTASEGAAAPWDKALAPHFKQRHVVILPDADKPGRAHAQKVAKAINAAAQSVRILDLYPDRNDGSDVSDWLLDDTAGVRLTKLAKDAPLWEPTADNGKDDEGPTNIDEALITELALLPRLQYEKRREAAAEKLGIRVSVLDKLVAAARASADDDETGDPSPVLYGHWRVEPWTEPVDGAALLEALTKAIKQYAFLIEDLAVVIALWIVLSWLHWHEKFATHSPLLLITSAEKDSGKTTLAKLVSFLVRCGLPNVSISGPALFRSISKWSPCLVIDEADTALVNNEDLRAVINSSWTRGDGVIRCDPDTHEPRLYPTFAPKVVAMKGRDLPDTTLSRSIIITMKPRRPGDPGEAIEDFDHLDCELFAQLRSQCLRWANDNADELARIKPEIPSQFFNRRRANWKPLLAIAEQAGGGWKQAARKGALAIEAVADTFDRSIGVQLLQAMKDAFEARGKDRITSVGLKSDLAADETAPWATFNRGRPISERQIAKLLKPFGVRPGTIRLDDGTTPKGYLRAWFDDAFDRFCSEGGENPVSTRHTATDLFSQELSQLSSATSHPDVADKSGQRLSNTNDVADVADKNPVSGGAADNGVIEPPERCAQDIAPKADDPVLEDRSCRHCNGPLDGSDQLCSVGGAMVWLHADCQAATPIPPSQRAEQCESQPRQQQIAEIRALIGASGFTLKDFLFTQPPTPDRKDWVAYAEWQARERRRKPIAHRMVACGITAHDLAPAAAPKGEAQS